MRSDLGYVLQMMSRTPQQGQVSHAPARTLPNALRAMQSSQVNIITMTVPTTSAGKVVICAVQFWSSDASGTPRRPFHGFGVPPGTPDASNDVPKREASQVSHATSQPPSHFRQTSAATHARLPAQREMHSPLVNPGFLPTPLSTRPLAQALVSPIKITN